MRERGIGTGAELARRSGVSAGVVNRLRRNRSRERFVQRDNLKRIASALSVPLDALIWRA